MFSFVPYLLKGSLDAHTFMFHQVSCCDGGASGDACVAVDEDVGVRYVLIDECVRTVEETLDVLPTVVRNEDTEMLNVWADE